MGAFDSRDDLIEHLHRGTNSSGGSYSPRQLRIFAEMLDDTAFDQLSPEERLAVYDEKIAAVNAGYQAASEARAAESPIVDGATMAGFGWVFVAIGVLTMIVSFFLETSVNSVTGGDFIGTTYIPSSASSVVNIGLLQQQLMVFQSGAVMAIFGAVLACAGTIRMAIARR